MSKKFVIEVNVNGGEPGQPLAARVGSYCVESDSKLGPLYRVTVIDGVNVACTCPGYQYRGRCKHVNPGVNAGEMQFREAMSKAIRRFGPRGAVWKDSLGNACVGVIRSIGVGNVPEVYGIGRTYEAAFSDAAGR
jgi:hypothetical protein